MTFLESGRSYLYLKIHNALIPNSLLSMAGGGPSFITAGHYRPSLAILSLFGWSARLK
jgi:hypothetical protein